MSYPHYEIFKDIKGEFRFNLKSRNGEIVLTASEGYINKSDCRNAIGICQKNSPVDKNYDKRTTTRSRYYFTLRSENGRDIGRSEDYNSSSSRDSGIEVVKRDGPTQTVVDLT
ncbi:MAG: YegP family protein [Chitinophagaceae bacterium]